MGIWLNKFKSEIRLYRISFFKEKTLKHSSIPDNIDYNTVLKDHAVLMEAYGNVLKKDSKILDMLFRSEFVQSHIYKKLIILRKIYLIEIATLYNTDNNIIISDLHKLVEDIDKFSDCLFYFSPIKTFISSIPIIAAAITAVSSIIGFFHLPSIQSINVGPYLGLLIALGLTFLMYLGVAALSFIDKRSLFM